MCRLFDFIIHSKLWLTTFMHHDFSVVLQLLSLLHFLFCVATFSTRFLSGYRYVSALYTYSCLKSPTIRLIILLRLIVCSFIVKLLCFFLYLLPCLASYLSLCRTTIISIYTYISTTPISVHKRSESHPCSHRHYRCTP